MIKDLEKNGELFNENSKVFMMCRRGNASKEATELALNLSFHNVINVEGGIEAVIDKIDPSLPKYWIFS